MWMDKMKVCTPPTRDHFRPGRRTNLLVILLGAVCAHPASAQIATDRPDFVEAASVVPHRGIQLETSAAYAWEGENDLFATPTLLRWGLLPTLELRLETALMSWTLPEREEVDGDVGLGDVALGTKWHWTDQSGATPSTAFLFHVSLPTGTRAFRGDGARPSLRAVGEWDLGSGFALGIMPGVIYESGAEERYWAGILGTVVGYQFTDSFRAFGELALVQIAGDQHGGNIGAWDFGVAYLLDDGTQFDAAFSLAATDVAPDALIQFGFSKVWVPGSR